MQVQHPFCDRQCCVCLPVLPLSTSDDSCSVYRGESTQIYLLSSSLNSPRLLPTVGVVPKYLHCGDCVSQRLFEMQAPGD